MNASCRWKYSGSKLLDPKSAKPGLFPSGTVVPESNTDDERKLERDKDIAAVRRTDEALVNAMVSAICNLQSSSWTTQGKTGRDRLPTSVRTKSSRGCCYVPANWPRLIMPESVPGWGMATILCSIACPVDGSRSRLTFANGSRVKPNQIAISVAFDFARGGGPRPSSVPLRPKCRLLSSRYSPIPPAAKSGIASPDYSCRFKLIADCFSRPFAGKLWELVDIT